MAANMANVQMRVGYSIAKEGKKKANRSDIKSVNASQNC